MVKEMKKRGKNYTKEEDKFLFDNAKDMPVKDMAEKLGRPIDGVRTRMHRLGINLRKLKGTEQIAWSKEEEKFLKDNYYKMTAKEISKILGRSEIAVAHRRIVMGLKTKTKPVPPEGRLRKSDGYLRLVMPLDENGKRKERLYHRIVYEEHNNIKLKKSEIIHHIDGDGFNNNIDNLWYCKDISTHKLCHTQLEEISYQMIQEGFILFDENTEKYYVNEKRYLESGDFDV